MFLLTRNWRKNHFTPLQNTEIVNLDPKAGLTIKITEDVMGDYHCKTIGPNGTEIEETISVQVFRMCNLIYFSNTSHHTPSGPLEGISLLQSSNVQYIACWRDDVLERNVSMHSSPCKYSQYAPSSNNLYIHTHHKFQSILSRTFLAVPNSSEAKVMNILGRPKVVCYIQPINILNQFESENIISSYFSRFPYTIVMPFSTTITSTQSIHRPKDLELK